VKHLISALALAALSVTCAQAGNPLFPKLFTADPAAIVDKGRVYLYVGHDQARPQDKDYVMHEWRVYSTCDMVNWRDDGVPLTPFTFSWDDIDPGVFIDDDGQAYLYWGNTMLKYAKLKRNMTEFDGPIHVVEVPNFTEAPYLHKRTGTYYLSYAQHFPEEIAYMTGPSPTGPWTPRGVIMGKNDKTKTIHQAFIEFNGKSYVLYHNAELPGGGEWRRSVAVEEVRYNADGAIQPIAQTKEGPKANPSLGCKPAT